MVRALRFLKKLDDREACPAIDPKLGGDLRRAYWDLIRIRNELEHMDDRLLRGKIPDGTALSPILENGQIEVGRHVITAADLAQHLRSLHEMAAFVADWQDPKESSPPAGKG